MNLTHSVNPALNPPT